MKCKTFKIYLQDDTRNFEEVKLNKFLEDIIVHQIFASVVNDELWTVLVFYDDEIAAPVKNPGNVKIAAEVYQPAKPLIEKSIKAETPLAEPVILTPEEEIIYNALREWRNERASRDGVPPYLIAQNDSLMQIAKLQVKTKEEILQIKGFGEKRTDKYGDEILDILNR